MNAWKMGLATALLAVWAIPAGAQERVVDRDAVVPDGPADGGFYKASDLIGMDVKGNDNEDLGEIQDLFIARGTNEVEYLILDTGVFADLGGKQPILPWSIVTLQPGDANTFFIHVPLTQQRIRTAPTVMLTDIDLVNNQTWVTQVNEFYATELNDRRVSRPDLDRNRDRSNRDADQPDANRPEADRPDANRPDADRPRSNRPDANRPDANRPQRGQRNPGAGNRPEATNPSSTPERRPASPDTSNKPETKPDTSNKPDSANKPEATDKPEASTSDKPNP